jgi:hypothetical protein
MINRKETKSGKILENISLYYPDALTDCKESSPLSIGEQEEQDGSQIKSGSGVLRVHFPLNSDI